MSERADEFRQLCDRLPEGVMWGAPLTPKIARAILASAASEREWFEAWFAASTFETMGRDWLWAAWQARAALPATADQPPSQEPQGPSGSLSESSVEARTQDAAPTSGSLASRLISSGPNAGRVKPPEQVFNIALNVRHQRCHEAAKAFWDYWEANGETHKHGYYESTWGAINCALRMVGVVEPNADAAVVSAQHGASDNSEQDQPKV